MKKGRKIFFTFVVIIVILIAAGYLSAYWFLNSLSVKGGAEGYPVPKGRVNVLLLGVARGMADTNMLCSVDFANNRVDIFSIPRDTYYLRKGHNGTAQKKINAGYGNGGSDTMVASVSGLTGVPIHYYVKVDYEAVKAIVDAMGGIPVEVPLKMNYDDPADDLHIHFEKGQIVRNGDDIIKLLRWRKNNHGAGGYAEGDLGRIKMQQQIVKLGIKRALNGNLIANFIKLQGPIKTYIKTNMSPDQMMYYISKARKIKAEDISVQTIPGETKNINRLSFFVADKEKMDECFKEIIEQ